MSNLTNASGRLATIAAFVIVTLSSGLTMARAVVSQGPKTSSAHTRLKDACRSTSAAQDVLAQASSLLQQAQYQQAADTLLPFAGQKCDPRTGLLLAAAFESMGEINRAQETLAHAHLLWPTDNSIAATLAREYVSTQQTDKAVEALEHFHATADTPQQEMEAAAVAWIAGHKLQSAQAVAELDYQSNPSIRPLLLLANTLQLEGRYKDVISLLQNKRNDYDQSAPFFITLAESEFDANIFDAARSDLEQAIKLNAAMYQAHYLLGNVLMKQGDLDGAAVEYRSAIGLSPDQPRTYYQLALVLRAKQQDADEESLLTKATEIDSHFALAHAELGRILLNQNRLQEAVGQLNLAVDNNPSLEQPYNLLARAYNRLGDLDKAKAMAKRLTEVRAANHTSEQGPGMGAASGVESSTP